MTDLEAFRTLLSRCHDALAMVDRAPPGDWRLRRDDLLIDIEQLLIKTSEEVAY